MTVSAPNTCDFCLGDLDDNLQAPCGALVHAQCGEAHVDHCSDPACEAYQAERDALLAQIREVGAGCAFTYLPGQPREVPGLADLVVALGEAIGAEADARGVCPLCSQPRHTGDPAMECSVMRAQRDLEQAVRRPPLRSPAWLAEHHVPDLARDTLTGFQYVRALYWLTLCAASHQADDSRPVLQALIADWAGALRALKDTQDPAARAAAIEIARDVARRFAAALCVAAEAESTAGAAADRSTNP